MNSVAIAPGYIHASVKRRKNTWYSIKDGTWTDPSIWRSNAWKRWNYPGLNITTPVFPQVGDDVYINNSVTYTAALALTVNNLFISGTLTASTGTLTVNGDIQATGAVVFTGSINLVLKGVNNSITTFTCGASSTVTYARVGLGDQYIMDLSYRNLTISGMNTKYMTNNLNIAGALTLSPTFANTLPIVRMECGTYDLTVTGTTSFNGGILSKTGAGTVIFIGAVTFTGNLSMGIDFTGNPTVEMRGGLSQNGAQNPTWNTGTGNWNFTTNNQTVIFLVGGAHVFIGNVRVVGAITVTNGNVPTNSGIMQLNAPLDGTVAGSTFVNKANLYFNEATLPMATGVFEKDANLNVVGYIYNGSFTLPYSTYQGLAIGGTGTKTAAASYTLGSELRVGYPISVNNSTVFELSTFDISVGSTTTINLGATLSKNAAGAIIFIGQVGTGTGGTGALTFAGNPTVELRGGTNFQGSGNVITSGSGQWSFTTNNQTLYTVTCTIDAPILISGAITVTTSSVANSVTILTGVLTGNNAGSTFDNRITNAAGLQYKNATQPMATGVLQVNGAVNTWKYNGNVSQALTGGTYRNMEIGGTATPNVKTLMGNVSVINTYTVTGNATRVDGIYTFGNP